LERSVAVVNGFETLGYLREDTDFVDLIDVGDDVCVGSFVLEKEGADVGWTTSEHIMDRSYRSVVFDENGFYVNTYKIGEYCRNPEGWADHSLLAPYIEDMFLDDRDL